jgi:hypothetical protein
MKLSVWAKIVSGYMPINAFKSGFSTIPCDDDIKSFIKLYIFDNIPRFVIEMPIVFDRACLEMASFLNINPQDIKLTGSAKLGFSLSPKHHLDPFSKEKSDLDFFIISMDLFSNLNADLTAWRTEDNFTNDEQNKYLELNKNATQRGFIDAWKIPQRFVTANKCNIAAYNAYKNINKFAEKKIISAKKKYGTIRCYKDQNSALNQLLINIKYFCQQYK